MLLGLECGTVCVCEGTRGASIQYVVRGMMSLCMC